MYMLHAVYLLAATGVLISPKVVNAASADYIKGFLDVHNSARAEVGSVPLSWSAILENKSMYWAKYLAIDNDCRLEHSKDDFGENLFWASATEWSSGHVEPQEITSAYIAETWLSELNDYNTSDNSCAAGKQCGHYTQMIWSTTRKIGCAASLCTNNAQIWVCKYDPPGNYIGRRPVE